MAGSDSAGVPWEGREFHAHAFDGDDGSAPAALAAAVAEFRAGRVSSAAVVEALASVRLLVPLLAELGHAGRDEHGSDKSQELSIVSVRAPDGRVALPAFSSVEAMQRWNPRARPVPHAAPQVAAAALAEGSDLVIVDPTSAGEFVVRRPALVALASGRSWTPPHEDAGVRASVERAAAAEPAVAAVALVDGDPDARLAGPQVVLAIALRPGLDAADVHEVVDRMQRAWTSDGVVPERIDSLAVRIERAVS
jgi:hypothetical protein